MMWRIPVTVLAAGLLATACGGGDTDTSLPPIVSSSSSTTAATSTTVATSSTSTSSSTSTTTSTVAETTTTSPTAELVLRRDGLGTSLFGADPDGVVRYVTSILGPPSADTGWVDPRTLGAPCPGTEVRFVDWGQLNLFFSDDSVVTSGTRHFVSYAYGPPPFDEPPTPLGLATANGITLGSTVRDVLIAYPDAVINPEDELSGPSFLIEEGLFGFLTGVGDGDVVISIVGGVGCGE